MLKAICLGRLSYDINLVVDKIPTEGTVTEFFEKQGCGGGSAGNFGYALAKWGVSACVAGVLGNDVYGTRIRKELEKVHIDLRYIEPSYDNDTPISTILINKQTKNHIVLNMSDKYVGLKKCDFDFSPDLIMVDGYDVIMAKSLLERFPSCLSVLDASIVTSSVAELLHKVKYAVCTQEFAQSVTGVRIDYQDPKTLVELYQRLKRKNLNTEFVVTLGEKGALYCVNNQIKISPSLKVETVDTFGCGQVFRAAFAYSILNDHDLEKAVKWGCIAAGLASTKIGARPAIPSLEEIKNIYEQNYA